MILFSILLAGFAVVYLQNACFLILSWIFKWTGSAPLDSLMGGFSKDHSLVHLFVAILSVCIFACFVNLTLGINKSAKIIARHYGDLIECILQDSMERRVPVEIQTESGDSYVAFPYDIGLVTGKESDVSLILLLSGYRDEMSREFHITKFHYYDIEEKENDNGMSNLSSYQFVFPKKQIVSVRLIDFNKFVQEQKSNVGK